jgi:hypothetical protein
MAIRPYIIVWFLFRMTIFDRDRVGFVSDVAEENGKQYFKFDTSLPGNSNSGHLYGVDLASQEKSALVEYLKQL